MPPKHRDAHTELAGFNSIKERTEDEIRRGLMAATVKETTINTYHSEVKFMIAWARLSRQMEVRRLTDPTAIATTADYPPPRPVISIELDFVELATSFTKHDLYTYFAAHVNTHPIQFSRSRAALRLAQLMAGTDLWAVTEEAIALEKGAAAAAAAAGHHSYRPRGTLTPDMAEELIAWVRARNAFMASAMAAQVGACLRISELIALTPRHILENGIVLTETKRDRAATITSLLPRRTTKHIGEWKAGAATLAWLQEYAKTLSPDQLLFPRTYFTIRQYNATIREGAAALAFPAELRFDGSHVLRHTGVGVAVSDMIKKGSLETAAKHLLMTTGIVLHYSLSLQERLNKLHVPNFVIKHRVMDPNKITRLQDSEDESEEEEIFQEAIEQAKEKSKRRRIEIEADFTTPAPTTAEREATLRRRQANSASRLLLAQRNGAAARFETNQLPSLSGP
eukprot:GILJ01021813.1.p1 GENE.GILJ01021813.1~~GILJ01021813.1.p1  ORF type:complete len:453 (+),score=32.88 GILJ01021813.1:128-1486(+)